MHIAYNKRKSVVRVRRLELLWVAPLEPKSSASTNFAIPALEQSILSVFVFYDKIYLISSKI